MTLGAAPPGLHDEGAYGPGAPRLARLARPLLDLFDRQRLSLVAALARPPARLVDIGAGRGRFVAAARRAGYDAFGIEPSARGVAAAAELGAPVHPAALEDAELETGAVEVVTLWHVLEHVDEPGPALERIHGWLRPGGALMVGVPNLESLQARLGGERWFHLDVPRHRTHFTPRGLHELLRGRGFEALSTNHVLLEHNPFGMWQSLVNRATKHPSYLYNLLKRNAPLASADLAVTASAVPLLPAAALVELAAGLVARGGTVVVRARRGD